jgi:hypothetical protein
MLHKLASVNCKAYSVGKVAAVFGYGILMVAIETKCSLFAIKHMNTYLQSV